MASTEGLSTKVTPWPSEPVVASWVEKPPEVVDATAPDVGAAWTMVMPLTVKVYVQVPTSPSASVTVPVTV